MESKVEFGVIKKDWLGKRKIRIYLLWRGNYHSFCWIQLIKDGSLSFGFDLKTMKFTEFGTAVVRSGAFTEHVKTITRGTVDIKNADKPHVTFHSPRIKQSSGIVQMRDRSGSWVDKWELDWFPVKMVQPLLYIYTGDIAALEKTAKPKGRNEIVILPSNLQCCRMELILYPILIKRTQLHNPSVIAKIYGFCPNYVVRCYFYRNALVAPALYMASNS